MTKTLTNKTEIPNWLLSIFVLSLISIFSLGWTKIDKLEKQIIRTDENVKFRTEQISVINLKLDEILKRLREHEMKDGK